MQQAHLRRRLLRLEEIILPELHLWLCSRRTVAPGRWSSCPAVRRDPCSKSGQLWRWCCRSIPPTTSACSHRWTGCLVGPWRDAGTTLTLKTLHTKCFTLFNLIYNLKTRVAEIRLLAFALWPSTASPLVLINTKDKKRTPSSSVGDRWQTINHLIRTTSCNFNGCSSAAHTFVKPWLKWNNDTVF